MRDNCVIKTMSEKLTLEQIEYQIQAVSELKEEGQFTSANRLEKDLRQEFTAKKRFNLNRIFDGEDPKL